MLTLFGIGIVVSILFYNYFVILDINAWLKGVAPCPLEGYHCLRPYVLGVVVGLWIPFVNIIVFGLVVADVLALRKNSTRK